MNREVEGFGLTTAHIHYLMPDYPDLIQILTRQLDDTAPHFPALRSYLQWWEKNIEGKLHSVVICHARLLTPREVRYASHQLNLN